MTARLDTIQRERAGCGPTASLATVPSFLASIDAHQRGRASYRVLSRGHRVHVVSNQPKKGFSTEPCPAVLTLPPVDWRRFCRRPFHSHRPEFSSLAGRLVVERAFPAALAITNSRDHHGSRRSVVHSATRQHFSQAVADVVHLYRLSYSPSFDGSKKPWKWRQELGKVIQGRGCFVQGGGRCD